MITRGYGRFALYTVECLCVNSLALIRNVLFYFMVIPNAPLNQLQQTSWRKHVPVGQSTCEPAVSVLFRRKIMDRYEQRRRKLLEDTEVAAGYREMGLELQLMQALDAIRKHQHISQEQPAARMGTKREVISRLFTSDDINPTLNTLVELLDALNLTADITIRHAEERKEPIKVAVDLELFLAQCNSRNFLIIPGSAERIASTSSSVLSLPRVRRRLPCASSTGNPMASSTCDGSTKPEVQAEPVEAAMPSRSRLSRIDSPSTPSKTKLALFGKRSVGCPVNRLPGIVKTPAIRRSRSAMMRGWTCGRSS